MISKELAQHEVTLLQKAQGALLGAAVGDALGWPQEDRSQRIDKPMGPNETPPPSFREWKRRAGGRFYAHEEVICPGEYSDDTQLLLCTVRSLLLGSPWFTHFTAKELPTWTLYARGAGGATKRAAESWLSGKPPWSANLKAAERRRYFQAGGNGVAMRIMPHAVASRPATDFSTIAHDIFVNGIATHGHPRALVGAILFGFVVWKALQQRETLEYGEIVDLAIVGRDSWSCYPFEGSDSVETDLVQSWRKAADEVADGQYETWWRATVTEMQRLLVLSQKGLKQGALLNDEEMLGDLGCYDRKVNGAGTIAAAVSVFLTSQYAADPMNGIIRAAFAERADTDTLASMTGSLLGAIHGTEWLGTYTGHLQDAEYMGRLAERLLRPAEGDGHAVPAFIDPIRKADLESFMGHLRSAEVKAIVSCPDGREGKVSRSIRHRPFSKSTEAVSWRVDTMDGQTLYVKQISRALREEKKREQNEDNRTDENRTAMIADKIGVKLKVSDLDSSRRFYSETLGLRITKENPRSVVLEKVIALVADDVHKNKAEKARESNGLIICVQSNALEHVFERVTRSRSKIVFPIAPAARTEGRLFQCYDPDGNVVEVFEKRS